ncbi:MAG: hypothetical protein IT330_14905 [Anaerolineae bacterium]|nr:hypothetical protein [Anaerolineae bacterium]
MRNKPGFPILRAILATLVAGVTLLGHWQPVTAHDYVAFIGQPYRGGSGVSQRWTANHDGIDFTLSWQGILAAADGNIDAAQWNSPFIKKRAGPL